MSYWINKALASLKKQALDKLPEDELNGVIPGMNPGGEDPMAQGGMPPIDPAMMGMPPLDLPPPEPDASGNVFNVNINGITFPVKLVPELVMKDMTPPDASQGPLPTVPGDPMADTTYNPAADPQALAQWYMDDNKEQPFSHQDQGVEDPLSQEEDGIAVHDTGNENALPGKVNVHKPKKTAAFDTPGAEKSSPYYPCSACANYDAANNRCVQGLDVEKVQAAKSCSWLNSNFAPFGAAKDPSANGKDEETFKSDITQLQGGGGEGASKLAKDLKKIWRKI